MTKRIIVSGVVGGLVLFVWGAIAWMVLPLHNAGIKRLPGEDVILGMIQGNVTEAGFYLFPCPDILPGMTRQQRQAAI